MNLIILTAQDCISGSQYSLTDYRAEHIRDILRASQGDTLEVGLLDGPKGLGTIIELADEVVLDCEFDSEIIRPAQIIDVVCALPRPQTLKKVLASAACMGVANIHFIRAKRVEKSYFHSPMLRPEKYTKYLLDGLAQGKNTIMPNVSFNRYFKRFFEDSLPQIQADGPYRKIIADLDAPTGLTEMNIVSTERIMLAIGPEGGWVPFEIDFMKNHGFEPFILGPWTLRVENALVATLAQLQLARKAR
ncbi:MAG: 16S rRNA (uracil(1498)-N(3))-methyltransferase [Phycisphaerae bacterium]|nr:16S rRNA (uracil(1498)-N(3))-methyltransferase [Phycisphaerae bacterium]